MKKRTSVGYKNDARTNALQAPLPSNSATGSEVTASSKYTTAFLFTNFFLEQRPS
jgi:hypothetical protein